MTFYFEFLINLRSGDFVADALFCESALDIHQPCLIVVPEHCQQVHGHFQSGAPDALAWALERLPSVPDPSFDGFSDRLLGPTMQFGGEC